MGRESSYGGNASFDDYCLVKTMLAPLATSPNGQIHRIASTRGGTALCGTFETTDIAIRPRSEITCSVCRRIRLNRTFEFRFSLAIPSSELHDEAEFAKCNSLLLAWRIAGLISDCLLAIQGCTVRIKQEATPELPRTPSIAAWSSALYGSTVQSMYTFIEQAPETSNTYDPYSFWPTLVPLALSRTGTIHQTWKAGGPKSICGMVRVNRTHLGPRNTVTCQTCLLQKRLDLRRSVDISKALQPIDFFVEADQAEEYGLALSATFLRRIGAVLQCELTRLGDLPAATRLFDTMLVLNKTEHKALRYHRAAKQA